MKDYCTLFFDKWWGDPCCKNHDTTADTITPWLVQNYVLARCVWASSYSIKCNTKTKKILTRYIAAPVMFLGTSTFGWYWRIKALKNKR